MAATEPDSTSEHPTSSLLPTDFFSVKSLHTLAGSAGAVWLCCAVVSSVGGKKCLPVEGWRILALILSEVLTISLLLTAGRRTYTAFLLAFLNGLLVFVNASGLNAVTHGAVYDDRDTIQVHKGSLFPFINEVDWWPDPELLAQRDRLLEENQQLRTALQLCQAPPPVDKSPAMIAPAPEKQRPFARHSPVSRHKATLGKQRSQKHQRSSSTSPAFADPPPAKVIPNGWRASQPTVASRQCIKIARATGSGCTFRITLDSIMATFAGRDSSLRSTVRFSVQEQSLSCHIPPYATPSREQKFILTDYVLGPHGTVRASYADASDNPGFYHVFATGQLTGSEFNGRLTVQRPPRLNHPFLTQDFVLHFTTGR